MIKHYYPILLLAVLAGYSQNPNQKAGSKLNYEITTDELLEHIKYLSEDSREGRYPGTKGSQEAVNYIVQNFKACGLTPAGTDGFLQPFEFITGINIGGQNILDIDGGNYTIGEDFIPLEFSSNGILDEKIVFAGYGFSIDDSVKWSDYDGIDAEGKWVMILRGAPGGDHPHSDFAEHLPLRKKAMLARDQKAAGILFVNQGGDEDELIPLKHSPNSTAVDILVLQVSRKVADYLLDQKIDVLQGYLDDNHSPQSFLVDKKISAEVILEKEFVDVPNVIGLIPGADHELKNEYIVLGAHFDHLGFGGEGTGSLTPDSNAVHNGADDNASGTAGILELAEKLSANRNELKRSILLMAFNAEEEGLLGSKYFVNNPTIDFSKVTAMINMDMIGRMSEGKITVGGIGTSPGFESILNEVNQGYDLHLKMSKEGYGPSDHASFYVNDVPVLFFFTGTHTDYHKPTDDWEHINAAGEKQILDLIYDVTLGFSNAAEKPVFTEAGPKEATQSRRSFNVTLGVIPSYGSDAVGLEIDGAKKEGPAGKAGMQKGDIITSIGGKDIKNIYDYMYRLAELKPGEMVEVVVMRGEKEITLKINL